MWLLTLSCTIHLCKVSQIYVLWVIWGGGAGVVLLPKWSNILLFHYLVLYCIILFFVFACLFVLCFYCYFCSWSFRKTLWRRLSLVISFYYCLSDRNTLRVFRMETTWRLRENVVFRVAPVWNTRGIECLWGTCWRLLVHWCLLKSLWLFFYAMN